jgi:predicted  nucleic acid-binding Zn-ribbon protein
MEKTAIKNVKDLRDELIDVYNQLRDGELGIREVKERANMAGKIIASAKIQLEYNIYTKSGSKIEFLEC